MGQSFQAEKVNGHRPPAGSAPDGELVAGYMEELESFRARILEFRGLDPGEILEALSAISGRLAEIRAQLYRSNTQRCSALRTREVDPLREEVELQFKIHSRRIALMEWELKLAGGAP